jgi:hypothetical protein
MEGLDLFGNGLTTEESQIKTAIEFLDKHGYKVFKSAEEIKAEAINCGYRVVDPIKSDDKIKTVSSLRNHFYRRLWDKFPNEKSRYIKGNDGVEYRIFKLFIKSRMEGGLNKENAIQECVALINIVFDYIDEFNFQMPIDIRILGTKSAGWVMHKAASILMRETQQKKEQDLDAMFEDRFSKALENKDIDNELDELLKWRDQNGKEKGRDKRNYGNQKW